MLLGEIDIKRIKIYSLITKAGKGDWKYCNVYRRVKGSLPEKGMFEEILKGGRKKATFTYERKRFQKSEKVGAKAQRRKCAWQTQG